MLEKVIKSTYNIANGFRKYNMYEHKDEIMRLHFRILHKLQSRYLREDLSKKEINRVCDEYKKYFSMYIEPYKNILKNKVVNYK